VLTLHVVVVAASTLRQIESLKALVRGLVARHGKIHVTIEVESETETCPAVDCVTGG
jgi:hypothetical protein